MIWFNPWGCLDRCLAPPSRTLLLLSILLVAMAAVMAVMDAPVVAVLLVVLAVLCVAVALWRRKAWLLAVCVVGVILPPQWAGGVQAVIGFLGVLALWGGALSSL